MSASVTPSLKDVFQMMGNFTGKLAYVLLQVK